MISFIEKNFKKRYHLFMWINRIDIYLDLKNQILNLKSQVLFLRGARQVGKTQAVLHVFNSLNNPKVYINLIQSASQKISEITFKGRDYFGDKEDGSILLKNIEIEFGNINHFRDPLLVFIDEADSYPLCLETIQNLARYSDKIKFIFTGSNLENIPALNAATGRKRYFDLYPISFKEFLEVNDKKLFKYLEKVNLGDDLTEYMHNQALDQFKIYLRLGGMPRILSTYFDNKLGDSVYSIPEVAKDLVSSIEEHIKSVLGKQSSMYEHLDILRKIARLSTDTLKFTKLQTNQASRADVKKIVNKTVGARVAHKIRLFEQESDLSKYVLFDVGIANYLFNGSSLTTLSLDLKTLGCLIETYVANEIIHLLNDRDDLLYWKSENKAEIDFLFRQRSLVGVEVKAGGVKKLNSLNSFAVQNKEIEKILVISNEGLSVKNNYTAKIANPLREKKVTLVNIPHYLVWRLSELLEF